MTTRTVAPSSHSSDDRLLRRGLLALVLAHIVVAGLYSLVVPIWESMDEPGHYIYIQYIANNLRLPPAGQALPGPYNESKQPPLYYLIAGLSTAWMQPHEPVALHVNPYPEGGVNATVHGDDEGFPFQGITLGVRAARLVTVLLSAIAVFSTFGIARLFFPGRPLLVLAVTAVQAFLPQYLFMSGIINNDAPAIALTSLALFAALRLIARPVSARDLLYPLIAIGAAALTKFNALTVLPVVLIAEGIGLWRLVGAQSGRYLKQTVGGGVVTATVAVAGVWLYARDLLQRQTADVPIVQVVQSLLLFVQNPRAPYFGWDLMPGALWIGFTSSWGVFGWDNVPMSDEVYTLLLVLCGAALAGCLYALRRQTRLQRVYTALFAGAVVSTFVATAYFALFVRNPSALMGRYLLIAGAAEINLFVIGLAAYFPQRWQERAMVALAAALAVWALLVPFSVIMPVYARPATLGSDQIASVPNRMQARFGDEFELVGYRIEKDSVKPGDVMPLTLYWHVLKPTPNDYTIAVHLITADGRPVYGIDHYPGGGNYPTSFWKQGEIIPDQYEVPINVDIADPSAGKVVVSAYLGKGQSLTPLKVSQGEKPAVAVTFGEFRLLPLSTAAQRSRLAAAYQFGSELALTGYDAGHADNRLRLTLYWQALRAPEHDYTLFVHLADAGGNMLAQYDSQPFAGHFPTSLWRANESFVESIELPLKSPVDLKTASLWLGLYRLETMQRLAVTTPDGQHLPNDEAPLHLPD